MSKSQYITLSSSISVYNVLLDHLEKLLDHKNREYCTIPEVRTAIKKGYEKLKTYYAKTDESLVYSIATGIKYFLFIFFSSKSLLLLIIYLLIIIFIIFST
jgi:hypothetical protein